VACHGGRAAGGQGEGVPAVRGGEDVAGDEDADECGAVAAAVS
jgi:hypothetical protein